MSNLNQLVEQTLYFVAQKGWTRSREGFFTALVTFLGEQLSVEYALVDELLPDQRRARTVGLYASGKLVPDMEYELRGTPCENVMGKTLCVYPRDVQELFPKDVILRDMGVESYVGIPLWDSSGAPLGLIALMGKRPLMEAHMVETILQIVAVRCAHELERRRAEEEVCTLNRELEARVAMRTAALQAANDELEAFAYSVSHDLRAPLRHIDGYLNLIGQRSGSSLDERSRHCLSEASEAARRLGGLIEDLLSFSRMGRSKVARVRIDMNALVREIVRELEPEAQGRSVDWNIAELPEVRGDRAMLRIALQNLIENALKFSRRRQQAEIEIAALPREGEQSVFFVRDNGVGFDPKYADQIFGVFKRLHGAEEFEGTGIGLANVRRVMARHRGRVWAEGVPDRGATFYFSLPLSLEEQSEVSADKVESPA